MRPVENQPIVVSGRGRRESGIERGMNEWAGEEEEEEEEEVVVITCRSVKSQESNEDRRSKRSHHKLETSDKYAPLSLSSRTYGRKRGSIALMLAAGLLLVVVAVVTAASGQSTRSASDQDTISTSPAPSGNTTESQEPTSFDPTTTSSSSSSGQQQQQQQQQQQRLKPVNFTLVDEIFNSALADDEVAKRWKRMDSQLQEGMKSILKMIFPQIVAISQDAKVSGDCSGGILKWILSLRNLRSWAIKMLDATGKPSAGIFEGSLSMLGNYRQCLNIRAPDEDEIEITDQFEEYFRGQFCVLHLKPYMPSKRPFYHLNESFEFLLRKNYKYYEKTLYDELAEIAVAFNFVDIRMDLCVPSSCSVADIQRVAELLSKTLEMRAKVMRCDTASRDTTSTSVSNLPILVQKLDRTTLLWLALPIALILLSLVSSILVKLGFESRSSRGLRQSHFCPSPSSSSSSHHHHKRTTGKVFALFESLSIVGSPAESQSAQQAGDYNGAYAHGQESGTAAAAAATTTTTTTIISQVEMPETLHGLRNLFVLWFIIVQMTVELNYQYLRESLSLRDMILAHWPFQIIINSSLLFEALIVMSAFIYSYSCIESNLKSLTAFLVQKYLSLALPVISLIALTIVTPMLAVESPVWFNFVQTPADTCKSTGYVNLFFLQNFISYDKICLPHTWLFCVELQLFVLMIPLMLDLRKNFSALSSEYEASTNNGSAKGQRPGIKLMFGRLMRSHSGLLAVLLICIGYCVNFVLVYSNELPPSWFYSFPDPEQRNYYFGKYLTKTWTHLSSFLIGLLAGHLSRSHRQLTASAAADQQQQQQQQETMIVEQLDDKQQCAASTTTIGSLSNQSPQLSHGSTATMLAMVEMSAPNLSAGSPSSGRRESSSMGGGLIATSLSAGLAMLLIVMSTFGWSTSRPAPLVAALYDASSRLVWSLALSAIMFQLCQTTTTTAAAGARRRQPPLVERWLGHPLMVSMGRLAPLAYLVSPYVNTLVLAVEEQALFPSMLIMFHVILGNVVIIYAMALLLSTVIERPATRLVSKV